MNPTVTENITTSMSELQLQFLQHLKIQPLQMQLTAPAYQPDKLMVVTQPGAKSITAEAADAQWLLADDRLPLVQDVLCYLQQVGLPRRWFYQAESADVQLTNTGLYSAAPQSFRTPGQKKQLWQRLHQLTCAKESATTDPI